MIFYYVVENVAGDIVDEFEYEVDGDKLDLAFEIILNEYPKEELIGMIMEGYTIDDFKDQLKEYFEYEAIAWRNETR